MHATYGGARWIVIITIFVFAIVYSMSKSLACIKVANLSSTTVVLTHVLAIAWAIGMKLFASEIQPAATRASATSLGQSANCVSLACHSFLNEPYNSTTTDLPSDHEFLRRPHHPRPPRPLLIRNLLPFRRRILPDRCRMHHVHARDQRPRS